MEVPSTSSGTEILFENAVVAVTELVEVVETTITNHPKIFPGFKIELGSNTFLMSRINWS